MRNTTEHFKESLITRYNPDQIMSWNDLVKEFNQIFDEVFGPFDPFPDNKAEAKLFENKVKRLKNERSYVN